MNLTEGQRLIVIRYGNKVDCIERHEEILRENKYVWFGKIGVVPSRKVIDDVLNSDISYIILYSKGNSYICEVEEIIYEKPESGYPHYYETELFNNLIFPKSYYKLRSMEKMTKSIWDKLRVVSSGNWAADTLNHSMSSFFYVVYGNDKSQKSIKKCDEMTLVKVESTVCKYMVDGMCNRKGFVNYKYECERPKYCSGRA